MRRAPWAGQKPPPWARLDPYRLDSVGLVGLWPLNEDVSRTLKDATGRNAQGSLTSGVSWARGNLGQPVLSFPGGTTHNAPLGLIKALDSVAAASFTCWIYPRVLPFTDYRGVIGRGSNSTRAGWIFGLSGASNLQADWGCLGGTSTVQTGNLTAARWQHLAIVYDSAVAFTAYLNGVVTGTPAVVNGLMGSADATALLGQIAGFGTWDGLLDAPRFWNRALTQSQIIADMLRPWSMFPGPKVSRFKVSSGTTFTSSLTGSLSLSGSAATKAAAKPLAGSLSLAATLGKSGARPLAGSLGLAGVLGKQPAKPLAGSLGLSGSSVARACARGLTGTLALAGSLGKAAAKPLAGSLSLSGSFSKIRAVLLSLIGSLGLTGATVAKADAKGLVGALGFTPALGKRPAKPLAGSLSLAGSFAKIRAVLLSLAGSLALAGATVRKSASKGLTGPLSLAATLAKAAGRLLSGALGLAGSYGSQIPGVLHTLELVGQLAISGSSVAKSIGKAIARTLGLSGVLTRDSTGPVTPATCASTDMMSRGMAWLTTQLQAYASQPVVYRQGAAQIACCATFGRKLFKLDDGMGGVRMEWTDRDFLIPAASLVVAGELILPQRGDLVTVTHNGVDQVYEVLAPGGEPPWTWSDPFHKMLRIHAKHVASEDA